MSVDIYLTFNGNCREAVLFYAEVFGTETPKIMTFGDQPANPDYPLPEGTEGLIMHTRLNIDGSNVMFSDNFPGMPFVEGNNITLSLINKNEDEIRAAYEKLSKGGEVVLELQETSWSKLYGQVTDKFGIGWQFNLDSGEIY
ncbi:VOC family protein [Oceanobacillus chungangensis]|uniref:PhnB-like domain-containing protein n=1 Tax=Oceanobacillus chungangensis TaxID=1229152 RepID=A0A3D8PHR8_9BACI|nr:VOC family protein [Oceanobacillus chungangensis]RDW15604.1 hypothetical protein CWR45_17680 [Oceanobacillus chungangensis]